MRARFFAKLLPVFLLAISVHAAGRVELGGHVPAAVKSLQPVGRMPGAERLRLAIGLPLRNKPELEALLRQIYDPASSNYQRYLSPEEFTEKFGPALQEYQAVLEFAEASGFKVTATHPNRVVLSLEASVADIERAF